MALYYFDVMDEGVLDQDEYGIEFKDVETMQSQAMRAAGMMVSEKMGLLTQPWSMLVRNAGRKLIITLTFAV